MIMRGKDIRLPEAVRIDARASMRPRMIMRGKLDRRKATRGPFQLQ